MAALILGGIMIDAKEVKAYYEANKASDYVGFKITHKGFFKALELEMKRNIDKVITMAQFSLRLNEAFILGKNNIKEIVRGI